MTLTKGDGAEIFLLPNDWTFYMPDQTHELSVLWTKGGKQFKGTILSLCGSGFGFALSDDQSDKGTD